MTESAPDSLVNAILAYVIDHPHAADTIEGIRSWWVPNESAPVADIWLAVEVLVTRGWLIQKQDSLSVALYKLNSGAAEEIQRHLRQTASPGMEGSGGSKKGK